MKYLRREVLLCLFLFSGTVFGNTLSQQRDDFLQAEKLIAQGETGAFLELSASLIDYPLYPYLQYLWLKNNLHDTGKILDFFSSYKETRFTGLLTFKWLDYLAKNQRWSEFLQHYKPTQNSALECQYGLAIYHQGNQQQALNAAKRLWVTGDSLPQECDPLWAILMNSPSFTPELIWQRFELALNKDNVSVAEYVRRSLTKTDQDIADVWLQVHQKPALLEDSHFLNKHNKQSGRIFAHGVDRLAKSDLSQAIRLWDAGKHDFWIDNPVFMHLERRLALGMAYSRDPGAYYRLSQLPVVDAEVNEWKVRAALLEQNWQHVTEALEALTTEERQDPKWQYWQARALDKIGNSVQAQELYNKAAEDRSFYGFLAADNVHKPYRFANKPIFPEENELSSLANETDFKVIQELNLLNRDAEAKRQWWYAVNKLSKERCRVAAKLAQRWHWDQIAIITLVKADYWDDLALRFPVNYSDQIHNNASRNNLDPSIVFGLIRQESIFNKDAESAVGARGLMQIMPKTGMQIAGELKEQWRSDQSLFDSDVNIKYGAYYYKKLLNQFQGHFALAVAAYNAGPARVARWLPSVNAMPADIWIETIPFKETRKYVAAVLYHSIIYQEIMKKEGLKMKELMLDVSPG
ncbi:MAG: transglycosylase SLT domain-containing protein [Methylobacter sp.]|uniref:Transglycosylase SLT domain-containing protein n=1 Tax=Candidatus Methylobacter titanis TaxID=3053457 RepID=A0AA43TH83_9GAMM|nr:transglycosylase SLT domain-containing protein [Candidatus Methylobacter titanis]MDI1293559.1 transglycosylase SLT domain-containing protein [Candidatus Methylobacter titanis]